MEIGDFGIKSDDFGSGEVEYETVDDVSEEECVGDTPMTENVLSDYARGRMAGYAEGYEQAKNDLIVAVVRAIGEVRADE